MDIMAEKSQNVSILEQLQLGIARFELSSSPVSSISPSNSVASSFPLSMNPSYPLFAKIGPVLGIESPALRKAEQYKVQKVTGDGRCLFRALAKGMAFNRGIPLRPFEEKNDADDLRMAVKEVICDNGKEKRQYEAALIAITVEEPLERYCQRIRTPDFWGGESELLVLSKLCKQPIIVYIPEHENGLSGL
ncbi:OVARIAN TUMOR DOMAIN-containing deubiquitinating enzyme 3 isoform X2 [Cucumis sativus]|uniref:OVARIAN TUMOR DOMAIN-containing deubiquitinating enzyme 3 isoform X2 n=1 Tax=Cucumis sativus TaxID=3659 RepID=UPI0012F518CF|nr:OVARIAN TUMOR DOMAIN-containing deubiquitinating enzyme 3 isoform X2 [Cucumis sativus]